MVKYAYNKKERADRRKDITEFYNPRIEELFFKNCIELQKLYYLETWPIYCQIEKVFLKLFKQIQDMQSVGVMGSVKYVVISSLRRGRRIEDWLFRIEAMDKMSYLSNDTAVEYYQPLFMIPTIVNDLSVLLKMGTGKFPRLNSNEKDTIAELCLTWFETAVIKLFREIMDKLFSDGNLSGLVIGENARIIYGDYMDGGIVLYPLKGKGQPAEKEHTVTGSAQRYRKDKYYLLEADEGNNIPHVINRNDIIRIQDINQENAHRISTFSILEMTLTNEATFPDVLHFPFFLVSREFTELARLYDEEIEYKYVKLLDKKNDQNRTYYLPILPEIECLSEKSNLNLNRSIIEKMVLSGEKIGERAIFRIKGFTRSYVVVRLDFAESMKRRNATGIVFKEVEII